MVTFVYSFIQQTKKKEDRYPSFYLSNAVTADPHTCDCPWYTGMGVVWYIGSFKFDMGDACSVGWAFRKFLDGTVFFSHIKPVNSTFSRTNSDSAQPNEEARCW